MTRLVLAALAALLALAMIGGPVLAQGQGQGPPPPPADCKGKGNPNTPQNPKGGGKGHGTDGCYPPQNPGKREGRGPSGPSSQTQSSATAGKTFTATGSGWKPNSEVSATMHSTPVDLGTVAVDGAGAFNAALTIPADAEPGAHTIRFSGTAPDGGRREVSTPLIVTAPAALTATTDGGTITVGMAALAAVVFAGAGAYALRRRRTVLGGSGG